MTAKRYVISDEIDVFITSVGVSINIINGVLENHVTLTHEQMEAIVDAWMLKGEEDVTDATGAM